MSVRFACRIFYVWFSYAQIDPHPLVTIQNFNDCRLKENELFETEINVPAMSKFLLSHLSIVAWALNGFDDRHQQRSLLTFRKDIPIIASGRIR